MEIVIEIDRPTITVDSQGDVTRAGGKLLTLDTVTDAAANMSMIRPSDGNFSLANPRDKWFNSARKLGQLTLRQKEVSDYLLKALDASVVAERNVYRRKKFWDLLKTGKITKETVRQATAFGVQAENGQFSPGQAPDSRETAYALYEYFCPQLDLMNRVWFNFADRNDELVAGFTGFISTANKARSPGSHGTITLQCRSLLSLMQQSEIVVAAAIDQKWEPHSGEDPKLMTDQQFLTNVLAGLDGLQIIERCVDRTQDIFCYNSGTPTEINRKVADDYFYQDKFWQTTDSQYPVPDGKILANNFGYGRDNVSVNPTRAYEDGVTTTEQWNGKLIFDPSLKGTGRGEFAVFEKAVRQTFRLYQNTNQVALNICREVADAVGYEFFDDPKGNLVFQIPKYDFLPRLRGQGGIENEDLKSDGTPLYSEDYSDLPFHDRDYILDSVGDGGLRSTDTENGLVNYVFATGSPNWVKITDETLRLMTLAGATSPKILLEQLGEIKALSSGLLPATVVSEEANYVRRLTRRFGVRRHNTRPLVTGMSSTNFLTRYAYQNMVRINAGIKTATVTLNQRPDIWLGRTVFLVEEQKLGYVVGTSNTFNRSSRSNHGTTLTLAYMHHPNERIGVPWLLATDSPAAQASETAENMLYSDVIENLNEIELP